MSNENAEQSEQTQEVINFNITDAALKGLAERHKDVDAYKDFETAKAAATECQKLRKKLTEAHQFKKADALAFGRRLDAEKNRIMGLIEAVENPIRDQLTEIKEKAEREEAARVEKINNEIERIKAFANDRHDLTVEELNERRTKLTFIDITEEFFQEFTDQAQLFKDEAEAKLRIAVVAEIDRRDEAEKLETQRKEQEEQQRKLDERQAEMDAEEAKRKAEQAKRDQEAADKLAKENAERQAELDKQAKEQTAEKKKIDDENARLKQEADDKEAAEQKAADERDAEARRLRLAPDSEKLERLATDLEDWPLPQVESEEAQAVLEYIVDEMKPLIANIRKHAGAMK